MDLTETTKESGTGRHPWEVSRSHFVRQLLKQSGALSHEADESILDIGCGDSYVIEQILGAFPKAHAYACDSAVTPELIAIGEKRLGEKCRFFSSLEQAAGLITDGVNCVLLLDVLEHVENDAGFLKQIAGYRFISPKTRFVITVPAFAGLFSSHDRFLKHCRRYSLNAVKSLAEKNGLRIVDKGYFYTSLLFPRIISVILEKIFGSVEKSQKGIGGWKPKGFVDSLIVWLLDCDWKLCRILNRVGIPLPGLSTYIVCEPSV